MSRSIAATWLCLSLWPALTSPALAEEGNGAQPGDGGAASQPLSSGKDDRSADVDLEGARTAFNQGILSGERGDFVQSVGHFERALAIHDAPAVRFNLASAHFELKQYLNAYDQLAPLLADESLDAELRQRAIRLEEALLEKLGTLIVTTGDASDIDVSLDGEPLPSERLGTRLGLLPGTHRIEATRGGHPISERVIDITPHTEAVVDLRVVAGPREAAGTFNDPDSRAQAPLRQDWRLWAGVGAAAVSIAVVALAIGLRRDGAADPVQGDFEPGVLTWD
jgi:hypothetical protein